MKFWSQIKNTKQVKTLLDAWAELKTTIATTEGMPTAKQLKIIIAVFVIIAVMLSYLNANPVVLSITMDDSAYDNYLEQREAGYSFHSTSTGTFYTTHGIHPFSVTVNYLLAPSENLLEAFENEHITIDDLERLDFDYWFKAKDK